MSRRAPTTTLLVSCALCHRLHEPRRPLDENPVCPRCAAGEGDGGDAPSAHDEAELEF